MAYGTELILGWSGIRNINPILNDLGLDVDLENLDVIPNSTLENLNQMLLSIYPNALLALPGLTGATLTNLTNGYFVLQNSPVKPVKLIPWSFGLYYDPDEVGDTPDSACFGISLISRYFPTFLDWRHSHGQSGDHIVFTSEFLEGIEIAKKYIRSVIPQIDQSNIVIQQIHY